MLYMVPNMVMMGVISFFFSGFVLSPRGYYSDEPRRRRGRDVDIPWETGRGDAVAALRYW